MKKIYLAYAVAAIVLILVLVGWFYEASVFWETPDSGTSATSTAQNGTRTIQLDGNTIRVEVADNDTTRELGLGGHAPLASDQGMLFVFPQDGVLKFWMKGMTFSLDIIWLQDDGTISYIAQNLSPATYPQAFGPDTQARYVLEVNAGYAKANGVKTGDKVQL